MILHLILWLLVPDWRSLALNPQTGQLSQKNLFGIVGFLVGIAGAVAAIVADIVEKREVDNTTILILLAQGLGLTAAKLVQQQLNRKTKDEDGALTQPAPPAPPTEEPKLMPQADPTLAGYTDPHGLANTPPRQEYNMNQS